MPYTARATSTKPALIVYLLDASDTMRKPCAGGTRMDLVNHALQEILRELVRRSIRDNIVQDRYHIAVFAYSTEVIDVLATSPDPELAGRSIWKLSELLRVGLPHIEAGGETNTHAAFCKVEELLRKNLDRYSDSPAPLISHFTDGLFSTEDPTPVLKRIRALSVKDGPVLVENVYVQDEALRTPIADLNAWPGVIRASDLADPYAQFLYGLSSPIPATHRAFINARGYQLRENSALFFPGAQIELIRLAFAASAATN